MIDDINYYILILKYEMALMLRTFMENIFFILKKMKYIIIFKISYILYLKIENLLYASF